MAEIDELLSAIDANQRPLSLTEKVLGYARSYLSGPTFGFADNIEAAIAAPFTDNTYSEELANIRRQQSLFKEKTDYLDNVVEMGSGAVLNPLSKLGELLRGVGVVNTASKVVTNPVSQAAIAGMGEADGENLAPTALASAVVGGVGSAGASMLGKTLETIGKEADRLKLSSFGIGYQDIKNQLKKAGDSFVRGESDLPIINIVDSAEKAGTIKAGSDAIENLFGVLKKQDELSGELKKVIALVDEAAPPVGGKTPLLKMPTKASLTFPTTNTDRYINALSGTAKEKAQDAANKEIAAITKQMKLGTVAELQNLKVGLNYKYDKNPYTEDVVKTVRQDLKEAIEARVNKAVTDGKLAPEFMDSVRSLNQEWGGLADLRDAFNKNLAREYGGDAVEDFYRSFQTTGGSGSFNIMSAATGNPLWAILGAGGNIARMDENKSAIADIFRTYQKPLEIAGEVLGGTSRVPAPITARTTVQAAEAAGVLDAIGGDNAQANQSQDIDALLGAIDRLSVSGSSPKKENIGTLLQPKEDSSLVSESLKKIEEVPSFNPTSSASANQGQDYSFMNTLFKGDKVDKQAVEVIQEIKKDPIDHAIMLMESAGDPNAKNPDSSASGLFQLIKKTATNLGVKDVFNPAENYAGYKKLRAETEKALGTNDVKMIYASHYLGLPTLQKWIDGKALSAEQEKQVRYLKNVLFPRLEKIYNGLINDSGVTTA